MAPWMSPGYWSRNMRSLKEQQPTDTQRLDFILQGHRKLVVERLPHNNLDIYVEEGFMGDKQYPAVRYSGHWGQGSSEDLEIKRKAIDAAIATQQTEQPEVP